MTQTRWPSPRRHFRQPRRWKIRRSSSEPRTISARSGSSPRSCFRALRTWLSFINTNETKRQSLVKTFSKKLPPKSGGGQYRVPYCQILASFVYSEHVDFPPEERAALHLLSVLYACVFWRGEADLLEF